MRNMHKIALKRKGSDKEIDFSKDDYLDLLGLLQKLRIKTVDMTSARHLLVNSASSFLLTQNEMQNKANQRLRCLKELLLITKA